MNTRIDNSTSYYNQYNFNFNVNINGADPYEALERINNSGFRDQLDRGSWRPNPTGGAIPQCGCISRPTYDQSMAPSKQGLTDAPDFGPNATRTAGGFVVDPQGNARVNIYSPGQKPGEDPWGYYDGDPHFHQKTGVDANGKAIYKDVDFSGKQGEDVQDKSAGMDMVLPDGTRTYTQLSGDGSGHPVTTGLTIQNGQQLRQETNLDGTPKVGAITNGGYEWRANHVATQGDRVTWDLGGSANHMHIFQEQHGQVEGEVMGSHNDSTGTYTSDLDPTKTNPWSSGRLRPQWGSAAWGDQMRELGVDRRAAADGNAIDFIRANKDQINQMYGYNLSADGLTPAQQLGASAYYDALGAGARADVSDQLGRYTNPDMWRAQQYQQLFGGWGSYFPSPNAGYGATQALYSLLNDYVAYMRQQQLSQNDTINC
jgi:hypothetical protein